jgi:hypothetical protein
MTKVAIRTSGDTGHSHEWSDGLKNGAERRMKQLAAKCAEVGIILVSLIS